MTPLALQSGSADPRPPRASSPPQETTASKATAGAQRHLPENAEDAVDFAMIHGSLALGDAPAPIVRGGGEKAPAVAPALGSALSGGAQSVAAESASNNMVPMSEPGGDGRDSRVSLDRDAASGAARTPADGGERRAFVQQPIATTPPPAGAAELAKAAQPAHPPPDGATPDRQTAALRPAERVAQTPVSAALQVDPARLHASAIAQEATSRRAESALDRRNAPADAPQAGAQIAVPASRVMSTAQPVPSADAQAAQAARAVAVHGDAGFADAARAHDTLLGAHAAATERSGAAPVHAALAERPQAAAAFAQIAPTLRKGADGVTELRLDPPELGRVRVTIRTDETGMIAVVQADRPETLELMRRHAELLMRDLAAAGQTKVDLSFAGFGGDGSARNKNDPSAFGATAGSAGDAAGRAPTLDVAASLRAARAGGGLDIRV